MKKGPRKRKKWDGRKWREGKEEGCKKRDITFSHPWSCVGNSSSEPSVLDKALHVTTESSRVLAWQLLQPLWPHLLSTSTVAPHPDSFLVKLVSNHPSPLVCDLLVKLSVTQDANRLRMSDNMVILWGEKTEWALQYPLSYPFPQLPAPLIVKALSPPVFLWVSKSLQGNWVWLMSLFICFDVFIPSGELTGRTFESILFFQGKWGNTKLDDDKSGLYCSTVIT